MKGQILDVYGEGETTFRACVMEDMGEGIVRVVNLSTAETSVRGYAEECENPVIENVFDIAENYMEQIRVLLNEEYKEKETDEMLANARIQEDSLGITVIYDNGAVDRYAKEARIILTHKST